MAGLRHRGYNEAMKRTKFPQGWDEKRTRRVAEHYEKQTEDEPPSPNR
jgi:hypothetical protein